MQHKKLSRFWALVLLLISTTLLFGCGSSSNTHEQPPSQGNQKTKTYLALEKIALYAQNGVTAPLLQDYKVAGVTGVNSANLNSINKKIKSLGNKHLANSKEKIQALVNQLVKVASIKISEVLAANTHTNMDTDFYAFSDWIELSNTSKQAQDIGGYFLSDDKDKVKKWMIPMGTELPAQSQLLIWADKKDKKLKELHANFKLSLKGETVTLADKTGKVIDFITFSKQESDISSAKINNTVVSLLPTPNEKNGMPFTNNERSVIPTFSYPSGFYDSVLTLSFDPQSSSTVYYTTDGSQPSKASKKYTQATPILINKTTVVRALSFEAGKLPSKTISNTYFINHQSLLPVVSLTTDSKYLFDDKVGIHTDGDGSNGTPLKQCDKSETRAVNYAQEWERPVNFEYFDENHQSKISLGVDFGITGQCSRKFPKKSLALELNSKYGTKSLKYKLYPNKDLNEIKDFQLRMGNKGYEIGDILAASLVEKYQLDVDYQAYRTVQLFMNGEYWGIYNIREKKGGDYLKSNYPNLGKVDILDKDSVKKGDLLDYNTLRNYIKNNDLADSVHYQKVLDMVDEKSFIDYMILMIYSGNIDWVDSNHRSWKEKKAGAKWRWMLDDIDYGFKHADTDVNVNINLFEMLKNSGSDTNMVLLFNNLLKNNNFKLAFKTRFNALLIEAFKVENVRALINKINAEREVYMSLEKSEWEIKPNDYTQHINQALLFANERTAIVKAQLDAFIP